jgi:CheY-like chemotaxis protein
LRGNKSGEVLEFLRPHLDQTARIPKVGTGQWRFPGGGSHLSPNTHVLALVVERNPIVQRLQKYFLEQAGYTVEFVQDGMSALARAHELRPAILVTEILVPKLDGLSLCQRVKADPETRSIMVLIFSHLEAEDRAREAGADAYLKKPIREEHLVETLGRLIAKHQESMRGKA